MRSKFLIRIFLMGLITVVIPLLFASGNQKPIDEQEIKEVFKKIRLTTDLLDQYPNYDVCAAYKAADIPVLDADPNYILFILYLEPVASKPYPAIPKVKLILYDRAPGRFIKDFKKAFVFYRECYFAKHSEIIAYHLKNLLREKKIETIIDSEAKWARDNAKIDIWKELLKGIVSHDILELIDWLARELAHKALGTIFTLVKILSVIPMTEGALNDMGNVLYSLDCRHEALHHLALIYSESVRFRDINEKFTYFVSKVKDIGYIDLSTHDEFDYEFSFHEIADYYKQKGSLSKIRTDALGIAAWKFATLGKYIGVKEGEEGLGGLKNTIDLFGRKIYSTHTLHRLLSEHIKARDPNFIIGLIYVDKIYATITGGWIGYANSKLQEIKGTKGTKGLIEAFIAKPSSDSHRDMIATMIYLFDWIRVSYVYKGVVYSQKGSSSAEPDQAAEQWRINTEEIIVKNLLIGSDIADSIDEIVVPGVSSSTILVIDTSGSMNWQDPSGKVKIEAAKDAAKAFLNMINSENSRGALHQISVVTFSSSANLALPLTTDLDVARKTISQLSADGGTNISQGLSIANKELSKTTVKPVIILLSDGVPTIGMSGTGGDYKKLEKEILAGPVKEAADRGYCIYVVSFGKPGELIGGYPSIDPEFLGTVAQATSCGHYYNASEAFGLLLTYIETRYESTDREEVGKFEGTLKQDETVEIGEIDIPPHQEGLYFTLSWPGSQLDPILIDPKGRKVDENYPGATIDIYLNLAYTIVSEPMQGVWRAQAFGRDVPEGTTNYAAIFATKQGLLPKIIIPSLIGLIIAGYFLIIETGKLHLPKRTKGMLGLSTAFFRFEGAYGLLIGAGLIYAATGIKWPYIWIPLGVLVLARSIAYLAFTEQTRRRIHNLVLTTSDLSFRIGSAIPFILGLALLYASL